MKEKTKPIHIIRNRVIMQVVYDRGCKKEEGFEFHLTPVITLAKAIEIEGIGYGVSFKWGFWAINFGYFPAKYFK